MFTVYVCAEEDLRISITEAVSQREDAIVLGSSTNLQSALRECTRDNPGVLVLDDSVLNTNADLAVLPVPCPVVLVADPHRPLVAKHSLAIGATDVISRPSWANELFPSLERTARQLEGDASPKRGKIIAVFSPKGGVGKTTIAANLAAALGRSARKAVLLADMNPGFGDIDAMIDRASGQASTATSVSLPAPIHRPAVEVAPNVHAIKWRLAGDEKAETEVDFLERLVGSYAYIVLDTCPGYTEANIAVLDMSNTVIVVCTPDIVTLRRAGYSLRLFRDAFKYSDEKTWLVVNRAGTKTGIELTDIESILKHPVRYSLPSAGSDPAKAVNDGTTFILRKPHSPLARAVGTMAASIVKEDLGVWRKTRRKGHVGL